MYAQSAFDLHSLSDTEKIVDVIREVRAICDDFSARGLPNFPSGVPFTFFEQYVTLRTYLAAALVAILVSVFLVLALVMCNPWIALIVVSECACARAAVVITHARAAVVMARALLVRWLL